MQGLYQKFATDIVVIAVARLLVAASTLVLVPLLTKTLGAHGYGIWTQAWVTISLALGFVGFGLPYALTRFLPAKTNKREVQEEFYSVLCLVFLVTLIVSVILIISAEFIAGAFFEGATGAVRITGLIILVQSMDITLLSLFRVRRQMKSYAIFTIATRCAEIGLIAYFVLNGHGILTALLCLLAARASILPVLFFLIKSQIGIKRPRFSRIKEYLTFGLPTVPGNISAWVIASSDRYVIAYFLGAASVGIYSAGYALGRLPDVLLGIVGFVLPPTLSKLYDQGRISEVETHLRYSLKYLLALAIPFVFGAAILAEPTLRLFSTAEIASQGYFVLPLVALSALFLCTYGVIGSILVLVKKTRTDGLIWIVAAVANLGLNIIAVPRLGILGAALATLVAYSLALGIGSYYSFKEFKFPIDWRFVIKSLIASAIMASLMWIMHPQSDSDTIIAVLVGVAVYGVALFLLKGFTRGEISFFWRLVQRTGPTADSSDDRLN